MGLAETPVDDDHHLQKLLFEIFTIIRNINFKYQILVWIPWPTRGCLWHNATPLPQGLGPDRKLLSFAENKYQKCEKCEKKDLPSESLRLCSAGGRSESLTRKSFPWKQIRLWLTYAAALAGPAMLVVSEWCLTTLTLTVTNSNWLIWEAKMWFQGSFALLWITSCDGFCSSPVFCFKNWSSIRILADPLHLLHHQAEVFPGFGIRDWCRTIGRCVLPGYCILGY